MQIRLECLSKPDSRQMVVTLFPVQKTVMYIPGRKTQLHNSFKAKRDKNNHFQYIKCHNAPVHSAIFHPCPDVVSPSIIMGIISSDENGQINVFTKSRPSVTSS